MAKYPIKAYARLLTMLGEQLIKNEQIALVELVKNAYDADANWVRLSFEGFGDNWETLEGSHIIVEDDGLGMSMETIKDHWLRPATPVKRRAKNSEDAVTAKGRRVQGEKGIGRFAVLKLGKKVLIKTRPSGSPVEYVANFDFNDYDNEFLAKDGVAQDILLEDIEIEVDERRPVDIVSQTIELGGNKIQRLPQGSRIEIYNLKGSWDGHKVTAIASDLRKLQSIFGRLLVDNGSNAFEVYIYRGSLEMLTAESDTERLLELLTQAAVLRVEGGRYDEFRSAFRFSLNSKPVELFLGDPSLGGLKVFKSYFGPGRRGDLALREGTECGSFDFEFYVFDLNVDADPKYRLDPKDKDLVKGHRIYLYRDNIRVYPYGESDDDWLRIDQSRGTGRAGQYLSNDQVVGYVSISEQGNRGLRDKTNREGLLENGYATADFLCLIQTLLSYLREVPYKTYRARIIREKRERKPRSRQTFAQLANAVQGNVHAAALVKSAQRDHIRETKILEQRVAIAEELAGVGLSVETASHDIMLLMTNAVNELQAIAKRTGAGRREEIQLVVDMLVFVEARLRDIQLLFRSAKQRRHAIRIGDVFDKVVAMYKRALDNQLVSVRTDVIGPTLVVLSTDAVLLQSFINLVDNALYWMSAAMTDQKEIRVVVDGNKRSVTFGDNGPGVEEGLEDVIFEPFVSGKGEAGRGLGLYIAQQLLDHHGFTIRLLDRGTGVSPGANFLLDFNASDVSEEVRA